MTKLLLLIVAVYSTIILTVYFLSGSIINFDLSRQPQLAGSSDPKLIGITNYYLPVVTRDYVGLNISLDVLGNSKIVTDDRNMGKLPLTITNITYVKSSEILPFLKDGYIGIVQPSQLQDEFKVLSVNDIYYYEQMLDKNSYPLMFIEQTK